MSRIGEVVCLVLRPAGPVLPGEPRGPEQGRARQRVPPSLPGFGLSPDVNTCTRRVALTHSVPKLCPFAFPVISIVLHVPMPLVNEETLKESDFAC